MRKLIDILNATVVGTTVSFKRHKEVLGIRVAGVPSSTGTHDVCRTVDLQAVLEDPTKLVDVLDSMVSTSAEEDAFSTEVADQLLEADRDDETTTATICEEPPQSLG